MHIHTHIYILRYIYIYICCEDAGIQSIVSHIVNTNKSTVQRSTNQTLELVFEVVTIFQILIVRLILNVEMLYARTCDEYCNANASLQAGLSILQT